MRIRTMAEANAALQPYVPLVARLTGHQTTLTRILPLMELLGNPQDKLRVVHIAGTSGKTSTAYYLAALLTATGKKVGLTVSPHVDSVTERVQINGEPLSEADFCQELGDFLEIVHRAEQPPSYFELLYAFALWSFERHGVDYAVVETGMGGLYDATNVVTRADKVCVITDIGFDHTHILGNTLPEIIAQKIGIVHEHNQVFMYGQAEEIMSVARRWTDKYHATLNVVDKSAERQACDDELIAMADYQQRNWLLAHKVYKYLEERDSLPRLTRQALQKTQAVQVPARMDIRVVGDKAIIMDGAHNAQKMATFVESFQHLYPDIKPAILLGLKEDKAYEELVPLLAPLASRIITTTFNTSQDLPAHAINPELLAAAFRAGEAANVESITDQHAAFEALMAAPEKTCIITGSFYLLSQIRHNEHLA